MSPSFGLIFTVLGPVIFVLVSVIGIRMLSYWWSFVFFWKRYRRTDAVSTADLQALELPHLKFQITTRGSAGSTEVVTRGIRNIQRLASENPQFYRRFLSVEVVTESAEQARQLRRTFAKSAVPVHTLAVPDDYSTAAGTRLKARGLHYAVERRRAGWNRTPGRTFIVHYDEESVMRPGELRKLIAFLAGTDKKILEGPIFYPLEYTQASALCRTMEANRPIGCYECRHVMENGVPLHLHGSNLVVDEELENELGWDIGCLDGQPFIAEDYVFGVNAFTRHGRSIFGWHGCVMLEQPPFSLRSAFRQRYRWIFGVLQGMTALRRLPSFRELPLGIRVNMTWGTGYRIGVFALGTVVGVLSLFIMPLFTVHTLASVLSGEAQLLPEAASLWLAVVGLMWLGSVFIGALHNVADTGLQGWHRAGEIALTLVVAPVAGILEGSAALWAVLQWAAGKREVSWVPTPKTKAADKASTRRISTIHSKEGIAS